MNNTIIGAAGYILLLSNFIFLMLLIRRKFKHQSVSSIYILSASDILNSILTAIILLINHIDIAIKTNDFHENRFISNTELTDKYSNAFLQFYKACNLSDSHYFNHTSCNVKDLLMHNAMFLMPFTNAFISLLIFSIQCNLNTTCINKKFKNYLQFWMRTEQNPMMDTVNTNSRNEELKPEKDKYKNIIDVTKIRDKVSHVLQSIKFENKSEVNKGIVGISVLGQWLIPILFTSVLYFADYQNISMTMQSKSSECMYETPFSFYNHFVEDENILFMENTHSQFSTIPIYADYINNTSLIPLHNQSVTENDIISKIYDIMHLALNYTYDSSNDPQASKISNNYELLQIKENINTNISTNDITNNINITNFETNYNEWTITDNHNIENNVSTPENATTIKDNDNTQFLKTGVLYTMNNCVISTTFLRLYFLVLIFIIYFLPIILSSIFQVQGKLVCQNVLCKLKDKNSEVYSNPLNEMYVEPKNTIPWKSKLPNDPHSSKEYNNEEQTRNVKITSKHTCDQEKIYEDILQESIQVEKLFTMIKASSIISIILWTPMFLQVVLKVFLYIYVSTWIIDCTFLCAMASCIIRNIFNLKMTKTHEIQEDLFKKRNSIYPSDENI